MVVKTYPVESSHAALAAEIARLREVNGELVAALERCRGAIDCYTEGTDREECRLAEAADDARVIIARAERGS